MRRDILGRLRAGCDPRRLAIAGLMALSFLLPPSGAAVAGGLGSVWASDVTDSSITVNWTPPPSKYTPSGSQPYRVCMSDALGGLDPCFLAPAHQKKLTGATSMVWSGLQKNKTYRFEVQCYCKRLIDTRWRQIGTLSQQTANSSGGSVTELLAVTGTSTSSISVAVTYKGPKVFEKLRVCYRKLGLFTPAGPCGINNPVFSMGGYSGAQEKWNPATTEYFTFTGLSSGRYYFIEAFGFVAGNPFGTHVGKLTLAKTSGTWSPFGLVHVVDDDHPEVASQYLAAVESHYAAQAAARTAPSGAMQTARAGVSGIPILNFEPSAVHTQTLPAAILGAGDPRRGGADGGDAVAALPASAAYFVAGNGQLETASPASSTAEVYVAATGTWQAVAPMHSARRGLTLTRLRDGRILAAGGDSGPGQPLVGRAEVFDPATGAWTETGPMHQPRSLHTATVLGDGSVVVIGGATPGFVAGAERFDPAAGTWQPIGSLAVGRDRHTATLLPDDRILVAGGRGAGGRLNSVEIFDPATGTSTAAGVLHTPRAFHTATLVPEYGVVFAGGQGGGGLGFPPKAERYRLDTGAIEEIGALVTPRKSHVAIPMPYGRFLVVGGDQNSLLASVERFDPATGAFHEVGGLGTARTDLDAVLGPDGRVLAVGGRGAGGLLASTERFDPRSALYRHLAASLQVPAGPPAAWAGSGDAPSARSGDAAPEAAGGRDRAPRPEPAAVDAGQASVGLDDLWWSIAAATGQDVGEPAVLLDFLAESDPALFDAWQAEAALKGAGLDLRGWMADHEPALLATLDQEIAIENEVAPPPAGTLANISTRGWVGTGDRVMIGGFIVQGAPVKVTVRGRSQSLAAAGVPGLLPDPRLRLFRGQTAIAENDNWQAGNCGAEATAGLRPTDPREACLVATLTPGPYTAIVDDAAGRTGIALVEVFHSGGAGTLSNISTRGMVRLGDDVMIGGFIVRDHPRKLVVRARAGSLAAAGVPDLLPNPRLRLFSGQSVIAQNDDWQAGNCGAEAPAALRPSDPREACVAITLPPGSYTGIVDDAGGKLGIALVEVFASD